MKMSIVAVSAERQLCIYIIFQECITQDVQPALLAKSFRAKQNFSHAVPVINNGSPSRILSVLLISLGITTLPSSSDYVKEEPNEKKPYFSRVITTPF